MVNRAPTPEAEFKATINNTGTLYNKGINSLNGDIKGNYNGAFFGNIINIYGKDFMDLLPIPDLEETLIAKTNDLIHTEYQKQENSKGEANRVDEQVRKHVSGCGPVFYPLSSEKISKSMFSAQHRHRCSARSWARIKLQSVNIVLGQGPLGPRQVSLLSLSGKYKELAPQKRNLLI